MNRSPDFRPKPISHIAEPYLRPTDEHVVIAEITDNDVNGYSGVRQLYTGLIPTSEVDKVLNTVGGIGWKVESWGPHPDGREGTPFTFSHLPADGKHARYNST